MSVIISAVNNSTPMSGKIFHDLIIECWRNLIGWYVKNCRYWEVLSKLSECGRRKKVLDLAYGLWGAVWHEADLILYFAHRLLMLLESKGIEMYLHINYKLKPSNFKLISRTHQRILSTVEVLRHRLGFKRNWYPELDLIITEEEFPFTYCMEFKYYHYLPGSWDAVKDLQRKVLILKTLRECGVCNEIALLVLDDAICRRSEELCKGIRDLVREASNDLLALTYHISYDDLLRALHKLSNCKSQV